MAKRKIIKCSFSFLKWQMKIVWNVINVHFQNCSCTVSSRLQSNIENDHFVWSHFLLGMNIPKIPRLLMESWLKRNPSGILEHLHCLVTSAEGFNKIWLKKISSKSFLIVLGHIIIIFDRVQHFILYWRATTKWINQLRLPSQPVHCGNCTGASPANHVCCSIISCVVWRSTLGFIREENGSESMTGMINPSPNVAQLECTSK